VIRIERMTLRLPPEAGDPERAARQAAAGLARGLERRPTSVDRLAVSPRPGEELDSATAAALRAHERGERQ
jgi:hypothetical protein